MNLTRPKVIGQAWDLAQTRVGSPAEQGVLEGIPLAKSSPVLTLGDPRGRMLALHKLNGQWTRKNRHYPRKNRHYVWERTGTQLLRILHIQKELVVMLPLYDLKKLIDVVLGSQGARLQLAVEDCGTT